MSGNGAGQLGLGEFHRFEPLRRQARVGVQFEIERMVLQVLSRDPRGAEKRVELNARRREREQVNKARAIARHAFTDVSERIFTESAEAEELLPSVGGARAVGDRSARMRPPDPGFAGAVKRHATLGSLLQKASRAR